MAGVRVGMRANGNESNGGPASGLNVRTSNNSNATTVQGNTPLRYSVIFCSSHDPQYPPTELEAHSPQTKGWQSPPYAPFPQELGLEFHDGAVSLRELQLLSHACKIASKIDVFVGSGNSYANAQFKRIGHFSLNNNERSDFRARELKTVYIDAQGSFLKLLVHKCHLNKHNMFNQAGIIAINILGTISSSSTHNNNNNGAPAAVAQYAAAAASAMGPRGGKPPATDDLALEMNFDPVTVKLIRQVAVAKEQAVEREEYEQAKRFKLIENQLKAVGVQVSKLVAQKLAAVKAEDYDAAQSFKNEINRIRSGVDAQALRALNQPSSMQQQQQQQPQTYGGFQQQYAQQHHYDSQQPQHQQPSGFQQQQQFGGGNRMVMDAYSNNQHLPSGVGGGGRPESDTHHLMSPADAPMSPHKQRFPAIGVSPGTTLHGQQEPILSGAPSPALRSDDNRPLPALAGKSNHNQYHATYDENAESARSIGDTGVGAAANESQQQLPGPDTIPPEAHRHHLAPAVPSPVGSPGPGGAGGALASEPHTPRREEIIANGGVDPLAGVPGAADLPEPEELPPNVLNDAQVMIRVLGMYVVQCLYSRQVKLRIAALQKAEIELQDGKFDVRDTGVLTGILALVRAAITDKIAQVYVTGLRLLTCTLSRLGTGGHASGETPRKSHVHSGLDNILPSIVDKLGDSNARVREGSHDVLLQLARVESVGAVFVAAAIIRKQKRGNKTSTIWKPILERLKVMNEIVADMGVSEHPQSPLSLESIMQLIADSNGHSHPHSEVRDAARDLTMVAYRAAIGSERHPWSVMETFLADLRPKQLEEYEAGFSLIDLESGVARAGHTPSSDLPGEQQRVGGASPTTARSGRGRVKDSARGNTKLSAGSRSPVSTRPGTARSAAAHIGNKDDNTGSGKSPIRSPNRGNGAKNGTSKSQGRDAQEHEEGGRGVVGEGETEFEDGEDEVDEEEEPFTCQFCFRHDLSFTDDNLDVHYWRECAMLTSCPQCEQVIEVSMLNEHLLTECDNRDNHKRCPRCGEAIASHFFEQHCQRNSCLQVLTLEEANRCPLCHKDIPPGEDGWRKHLLAGKGCPKNPRTNEIDFVGDGRS